MEISVYILCAVITLLLVLFVLPRVRNGNVIPGPKGLPLVGCLFEFSVKTMHIKSMEYAEKYGDLVRVNILGMNLITLNTVELVQKAFTEDRYKTHLNNRPSNFFGKHVFYGSKGIGFTLDGNSTLHTELRKLFTRGLRLDRYGSKESGDKVMNEIVRMKSWIKEIGNAEFDLVPMLKSSLSNLLSVLLSGESIMYCDDAKMFWEFSKDFDFVITPTANAVYTILPFVRYLPGMYRDIFQDMLTVRERILEKYLYRIRETHKKGNIRGYVDFLLDEQANQLQSGKEVFLTDETIKSLILELCLAGITTTCFSLSNLFLCLMNHPNYQRKAQEELNTVVGNKRLPTIDDRRSCPFLEALVMETLRYTSPSPFTGPHETEKDLQFEGFHVPTKSNVFANLWFINHDERIWGDPWTFRPERFLDNEGQLLDRDHVLRKNFIPFGVGRRHCIGKQFARSWMFLYTAILLQQWTFVPSPDKVGSCDPRSGDFEISSVLTVKSLFCTTESTESSN